MAPRTEVMEGVKQIQMSNHSYIEDYGDESIYSSEDLHGELIFDLATAALEQRQDPSEPSLAKLPDELRSLPPLEEPPDTAEQRTTLSLDLDKISMICRPRKDGVKAAVREEQGMDRNEVRVLSNQASGFALKGSEKKALRKYKEALKLTKLEISRIQNKLLESKDQPQFMRATVRVVLHDEWTEIALIIADIRTMMAIIYERIGEYDKAILCCREAYDVYDRQCRFDKKHNSDDQSAEENAARMAHMKSKIEHAKDSFHVRKQLHEEAIDIQKKIDSSNDDAIQDILYEAIFDKLSAALGLEADSLGQNHPQVAETLAFLSKLYSARMETGKAIRTMEQAIFIAEVSLGTAHPRTGEKYYDIAKIYERAKRDEPSYMENVLEFYERAIETFRASDVDYSRLVGSILNDVGVIYIQYKDYDTAVRKLSDSLASYESSIGNDKSFPDTAQVWRNLGECYVLRKEWEQASFAFESALDVQRDARKAHDTTKTSDCKKELPPLVRDESIANTLKRLGKSYFAMGNFEQAFVVFIKSLTIYQIRYNAELESPEPANKGSLSEKGDELASVMFHVAEIKEVQNQHDEAIALYKEALNLRNASDKERPKEKKLNHVHCAMCKAGIGNIYLVKKDFELAYKTFNEALQWTKRQGLPEKHPIGKMLLEKSRSAARGMDSKENTPSLPAASPRSSDNITSIEALTNTVSDLEKKANSQEIRGDLECAIRTTNQVLAFRRAYLAKRRPRWGKKGACKEKQEVAGTLVNLARLMLMTNRRGEAVQYFEEALALYRSSGLPKDSDPVLEVQRELERLN